MTLPVPPAGTFLLVAPPPQATGPFAALLEAMAERVFCTDSADEALQLAQDWTPDLVLIDLAITPGADEVCRRLLAWRAAAEDRFTPIGLIGDQATAEEALRLIRWGADDVLWRGATGDEARLRLTLMLRLAERYRNLAHRAREAQAAVRHERSLRRRAEALDALASIVGPEMAFDRLAQRLADAIVAALRADGAIVYDADMTGGSVTRLYNVGDEDLMRRVDGPHIERLAPRLAQESRPRQLTLSPHVDDGELWAVLAMAMPRPDGRLALVVLGRRGETFFGAHDIRLFDQMIDRATQSINHARLGGGTGGRGYGRPSPT